MDGRGYGEGEVCRAESGRLWVCHGTQCVPFLEPSTTTATTSAINTTRAPTAETDPMTFPELVGGGFVYKEASEMTWDDARANCRDRGGDLLVTSDFDGLEYYMQDYGMEEVWVGARNLHWLDGRAVTPDEWAASEPNDDENACIKMKQYDNHFKLYDRKCSSTLASLCRIGTWYP